MSFSLVFYFYVVGKCAGVCQDFPRVIILFLPYVPQFIKGFPTL